VARLVERKPDARPTALRKRAQKLGATDARTLLASSVPFVLDRMKDEQIAQVQRVLDAAVVDPDVMREANDLRRRAVIAESGGYQNLDAAMVRRSEKALESYVPISEGDRRVRLDVKELLSPAALQPTTDNPDEAAYLRQIGAALEDRGVWLHIDPKLVRVPDDPGRWMIDNKTFNAWVSFGPTGGAIPMGSGGIDRDALLGNTTVGAGYWTNVHNGPAETALHREMDQLQGQIESGRLWHQMLDDVREGAFPGVAWVSDTLGGADFPSDTDWDLPHKLLVQALELNVKGNIAGARALLVVASMAARNAAHRLSEYIDDTSAGADRAVTALRVVEVTCEVVGTAALAVEVLSVGAVVEAGGAAVSKAGASDASAKLAEAFAKAEVDNPQWAKELAQVRNETQSVYTGGGKFRGRASGR
jgi:hypothetical protein